MTGERESTAFGYPDHALRCADQVNIHVLAGGYGRWIAIRMSDGGTDGILYDSKADAVRYQLHETQCCYLVCPSVPMTPREAQVYVEYNRQLYAQGLRMPYPEAPSAMPPIRMENVRWRRRRSTRR